MPPSELAPELNRAAVSGKREITRAPEAPSRLRFCPRLTHTHYIPYILGTIRCPASPFTISVPIFRLFIQ